MHAREKVYNAQLAVIAAALETAARHRCGNAAQLHRATMHGLTAYAKVQRAQRNDQRHAARSAAAFALLGATLAVAVLAPTLASFLCAMVSATCCALVVRRE